MEPNSKPLFPCCFLHKTQPLTWVCLENTCEKRLLCSHCVIFNHKDVHKNFNEIMHIINDPLAQLLSSNHLKSSKINESLSDVIARFVQNEEDKLTEIYNGIVTEISKKFDEVRKTFHEDLLRFLKDHEADLEKIDTQRKDYLNFCSNYFTTAVLENRENLKEGLDLILSKFHSDNSLQKLFEDSVMAIPQVNYAKISEISLGGRKLQDIKWSFFTDKILKLNGDSDLWTFDPNVLPNEFEFSNNNLTCKSRSQISYATTLVGSKPLKSGVHVWSISIDQLSGSYLCMGILPVQGNMNYKANYYTQAYCVCTDKYVYNLNKVNGDISNGIDTGDVLEIVLDFESDVYSIKNAEHFEYKANNIKGKEFVPYFGFSNYNASQLSLLF